VILKLILALKLEESTSNYGILSPIMLYATKYVASCHHSVTSISSTYPLMSNADQSKPLPLSVNFTYISKDLDTIKYNSQQPTLDSEHEGKADVCTVDDISVNRLLLVGYVSPVRDGSG
jgi:predicted ATP-grasp superfamily ATP-dependent carboligase